jgi:hypothetical protein
MDYSAEEDFKPVLAISKADADVDLLVELVGFARAAWAVLLRNPRVAVTKADVRGIVRGAHLIRAAANSILAERTCDAASQLEMIARKAPSDASRKLS